MAADDDWRLNGQERLVGGATLTWKPYSMPRPEWDHDHCLFCWAAFSEPGVRDDDPEVLTSGYSTAGPPGYPREDYYWICAGCFADFRDRFAWHVAEVP